MCCSIVFLLTVQPDRPNEVQAIVINSTTVELSWTENTNVADVQFLVQYWSEWSSVKNVSSQFVSIVNFYLLICSADSLRNATSHAVDLYGFDKKKLFEAVWNKNCPILLVRTVIWINYTIIDK